MTLDQCAENHSLNCFFNSLFREWNDYIWDEEEKVILLSLNEGTLKLPVKYFSHVGRHHYSPRIEWRKKGSEEFLSLSFEEAVHLSLAHLSEVFKTNPEQLLVFKSRIFDSHQNIKQALHLRQNELEQFYADKKSSFIEAEQALFVGHTFHPHPKNRDGFSDEDFKKYSPEAAGKFSMLWFLATPKIIHHKISDNFDHANWNREMFRNEVAFNEKVNSLLSAGFIPFPVHPWQKQHLFKNETIQSYLKENLLIEVESEATPGNQWSPTSSLRCVYNSAENFMLKFSLSVRLTNSVRHLLPHEVIRGLQVMDVFSTETGKEFSRNNPQFEVLFEPAFIALTDKNSEILNESIVSLRMNPFTKENKKQHYVLATLTQDHPSKDQSFIGGILDELEASEKKDKQTVGKEWFEAYLETAFLPLIKAQANYGVMLGAHQQNLILELSKGMPTKAYFRDCQGTGYSQLGFSLFSKDVKLMTLENGNVLDEKMGNALFSYYLVINSTFNTLAVIARDASLDEKELLKMVREKLIGLNLSARDTSLLNHLLNSKVLLQKGNFLCSIIDLNENTTANPLSIYDEIPNYLNEDRLC